MIDFVNKKVIEMVKKSADAIPSPEGLEIRRRRTAAKVSQEELAHGVGLSTPTIGRIESGKVSTSLKNVNRILDWLSAYEEARGLPRALPQASLSEIAPQGISDSFIDIPRLEVDASAGLGQEQPPEDAVVELLRVSRAWLRERVTAPHNHLAIITAKGDSMTPTISDGDLLLLDTEALLDRDGIYVFTANGQIYVKRLQRQPDGTITAISDNQQYRDFTLSDGMTGISLLGRVVFVLQGIKI